MIAGLQSAIWLMRLFATDGTVCLLPLELLTDWTHTDVLFTTLCLKIRSTSEQTAIILVHLNIKLKHIFFLFLFKKKNWSGVHVHVKHHNSGLQSMEQMCH